MEIAGKTALVTGAGKRLGKLMALTLADCGANVVVHYKDSGEQAMMVRQDISSRGRHAWLSGHDLSRVEKTESWFADIEKETGGIDILINSASEYSRTDYESMSAEDLGRSMNIHVQSPLMMIRAMYRRMKREKQRGAVINILDSKLADPRYVAYHLGKFVLHALTLDLAAEMARVLRINAVAPGNILSPNLEDYSERVSSGSNTASGTRRTAKASNPLGIRGEPGDISDAIIYLLRADFVTGVVLNVDGGLHLGSNTYGL